MNVPDSTAADLVETALSSNELCAWCFRPLFRAHDVAGETILDPAPEAAQDYVPPTVVDGRPKRGGKRTYCEECGRVDPPAPNESRAKAERHHHLNNLLDHVADAVADDVDVDTDAAHDAVSKLNCEDEFTDHYVFTAAVAAALPNRLSDGD